MQQDFLNKLKIKYRSGGQDNLDTQDNKDNQVPNLLKTNPMDPNGVNQNLPSNSTIKHSAVIQNLNAADTNSYINIELYNPINNPNPLPIRAVSNITQSSPLLDNPSNYKIACARFTIPANIPLFIYPADALASQIYKVELFDTATNISVIQPLIFTDWCPDCLYPRGIYYYSHLLQIVNTALKSCYTQMLVLNPLFTVPVSDAIQIIYEPSTNLFYINIPGYSNLYFNNLLQFRMTTELYLGFFPSFPSKGLFTDPLNLPILFVFDSTQKIGGPTVFRIYNESPCIAIWNQFQKILILSNSIPINPEIISSSNQQTRSLLLDFEPTPSISSTIPFQYFANIFRWVDLISNQPLSQLEIAVQIQYRDGSIFPLYLQKNEAMTIKLILRLKNSHLTN